MFFRRGSDWVPSSSVVLYFKSSQIYLFDRILATSCFSAKTDTCFKITEFMFHNIIIQTNDKVQPLPFAKIKTYLNIALEGRLSIFYVVFNLQKCLILGTKHGRLHYLATLKIFLKLSGSTPPASACIISDKQSGIRDQHFDWNFLLRSWAEFINRKRWITEYLTTPLGL